MLYFKGTTMKLIIAILMVFFVFGMFGCRTLMTVPQSVCYNIPENQTSVICQVAAELNIAPEAVSNLIKVGNLAAISADVYTAKQAMDFIDEVETFLCNAQEYGLTYAAATRAATNKYKSLSPKIQGIFVILGDFANAPPAKAQKTLTDYDFNILYAALENQKRIVRPFLIE